MTAETAAPCRHAGAAPDQVIDRAVEIISQLASDAVYLEKHGLTATEYSQALPAAIERIRGRSAAENAPRRQFLINFFVELKIKGLISDVVIPKYAEDTIYRLVVPGIGDVAIIQKGCPDGAHSSTQWSVPDWAKESYIWWLCPSVNHEPGVHISKGVNRLKQRFLEIVEGRDDRRLIDGVIFHNEVCGTPLRPCPKQNRSIKIKNLTLPPPCLYVFPEAQIGDEEWNWAGTRILKFPKVLMSMFGITADETPLFSGHIGFQKRAAITKINISSAYGAGKTTTLRS